MTQYNPHDWMWTDVIDGDVIMSIDHAILQPSPADVSSISDREILCSYSWQNSSVAKIRIPGASLAPGSSLSTSLTISRACTNMAKPHLTSNSNSRQRGLR